MFWNFCGMSAYPIAFLGKHCRQLTSAVITRTLHVYHDRLILASDYGCPSLLPNTQSKDKMTTIVHMERKRSILVYHSYHARSLL